MADAEHLIVVPGDERPWSLLIEIADVTAPGDWVLVGGLMVHAHALRAGITPLPNRRTANSRLPMAMANPPASAASADRQPKTAATRAVTTLPVNCSATARVATFLP